MSLPPEQEWTEDMREDFWKRVNRSIKNPQIPYTEPLTYDESDVYPHGIGFDEECEECEEPLTPQS